jgi:RHS repeat-associated protein
MEGWGRIAVVGLVALLSATNCLAQKLNPTAKLVVPGRFVAPASIPLEAEVQVAAGRSIARVEFFAEEVPIGQATAAPYAINWPNVPAGEYRLRVRATDSQGATDWSPFVRVRVLENRDPRVVLIEPGQDAQFSSPTSILLRAQAGDLDQNLVRVDFYVDGALVGTSTTEPYSLSWRPVPGGAHVLIARAIDAMGAMVESRPVRISVTGNNAPAVSLTSPANGALFTKPGPITLEATATDADGDLARVDFYAGASLIGAATAPPYAITWANGTAGTHTLSAQATDAMGFTRRSSAVAVIVNALPTITLTSPASVVQAPGTVILDASAGDADGTVSKVDFYQESTLIGTDTTSPYSFSVNSLSAGTHGFTAVATDDRGATSTSVAVTVVVNAGPSVTLTAPASGSVVQAPGSVLLSADAADADGKVTTVDFYQGTTLIGTDATSPYSFSVSSLPAGPHSFTAVATDERGATTTSLAVTVIVNAAPTISLTAPAAGSVVQAPGSVLLSADATDTDGKVTKVDFFQGTTLVGTATTAPYTFPVSNLAAGIYNFNATAADDRGGVTTSTAATVIVNAAPAANLTSPTPNAVFTAPANIPISADVADTDGTVSSVEFYFGTTLIATKTAPPYSIEWTGVPQGTYSLSARAFDNNGGIVSSGTVNITVNSVIRKLYFIHVDHLNTPRLIADDQQRTVWRWDQQEPFGNNVPDESPSGLGTFEFPVRFPGQYFDKETNLHYNYFREYDLFIGRYVESDPIGLAGGMNTYAYVYNQPIRFGDPKGLDTYMCTRPLQGSSGIILGPVFHQYVCTWNDLTGQTVCGSIAPSVPTLAGMLGSPSRQTGTNDGDVYDPTRCQLVAPPNDCLESCIAAGLRGDLPMYDVRANFGRGRPGAQECQTFSNNILQSCRQQCGLR